MGKMLNDSDAQRIWYSYFDKTDHDVITSREMALSKKVSAHAPTDSTGKEFIAEVFARLCNGEKYDDTVMSLYRKLQGSEVNDVAGFYQLYVYNPVKKGKSTKISLLVL